MKNKKLKGFTLVELLVVIAILAVLATVSVVGYTSFITKANNSNALTECKQAEDIVLSDLISTGKEVDAEKTATIDSHTVTFTYSQGEGKVAIEFDKVNATSEGEFKSVFPDLKELDGSFSVGKANVTRLNDSGIEETKEETVLIYTTANNKGRAYWANTKSPAAYADKAIVEEENGNQNV